MSHPPSECNTIPKLLLHNAVQLGDSPANREKALGIWQTWTWSQVRKETEQLAGGLAQLGFQRGDKLAIIGDNRPYLYWAMVAAQSLGGVPVPLYQDSVAEEMVYVLSNADIRFAVVENQEQTDKLLEIKDQCPLLEWIIYSDPRGMRHYNHPFVRRYLDVQEQGREYGQANPGFFEAEIAKGTEEDLGILLYTSGTTGLPKGVALTFGNLIFGGRFGADFHKLTPQDEALAYLPMAWVGDNLFCLAQSYYIGFCVNCPESRDTVTTDLREIGPTYYFAPPAVFESLITRVMIRMEDAGRIKRWLFDTFMNVAKRCGTDILNGKSVSLFDRLSYALGELLVYGPLKNVLGFSRIQQAWTAGEAIGPDIFNFFRSLGINIKQLYGQTEATVYVSAQPDGEVFSDTTGPPAPGVELRIVDNAGNDTDLGEVIYRSAGVFQEYHKNPDSTNSTKDAEGWVKTGDAGFLDNMGHLKIIDRMKDVGRMKDGTRFAPKYIENKLKFFPQIKHAVCFGDQKEFATAFINIDLEAVSNWAERRNLAYSGYTDLAGRKEVYDLIQECVEAVNDDLVRDEQLRGSQIKRFLILHKELDPDDGELTRTSKVRRNTVDEKYHDLIAALDDLQITHHKVEAEVTFEDGRKGTLNADLQIRECVHSSEPTYAKAA